MNCPKCGTPAQAGAANCRRCGTALSGKAPASAVPDEIELMPLEPSKPPAHSEFEPPANLPPPPPLPGAKAAPGDPTGPPAEDYRPRIRGAGTAPPKSNLSMIVGGVLLAVLALFVAWRMFRTKNEVITGKPKVETTVSLNPNSPKIENIEVTGTVPYSLEVSITEGELLVGVVQRSHKDSTKVPDLKKQGEYETMRKGETRTLTGEFKQKQQYSWILMNDSKKPGRAKVKFSASP